jgi:type I restriction enzyme S subunit
MTGRRVDLDTTSARGQATKGATGLRRFKPYPAYKDSGVEWLGELPDHWTCLALARATMSRCDGPFGSGLKSEHYSSSGVRVIRLQNIGFAQFLDFDQAYVDTVYAASLGDHKVLKNDILIAGLGDDGHPVGRACVAPIDIEPAMVKADCFRFRLDRRRLLPRFAAYQLSATASAAASSLATGATRARMNLTTTAARKLSLPPVDEQSTIATFLNRATQRIDSLVLKKEQFLFLLQEERTALITRIVTNGLKPNAPMKNSGVEWLGAIPAHWDVKPLKAVSDLQTGLTLGKKAEDRFLVSRPYLRVANVQDGYLSLDDVADVDLPAQDAARYELRPGDVLMTEGGDFDKLGRGHVWEGQIANCLHQNHIFAVRPRIEVLRSQFLAHVMSSGYGRAYFTATSKQSTNLASTNSTKVRNLPIPLPSLSEQDRILLSLDRETKRVDALVAKVREAIDLLNELRTALIAAAVTGKIDVREEVA